MLVFYRVINALDVLDDHDKQRVVREGEVVDVDLADLVGVRGRAEVAHGEVQRIAYEPREVIELKIERQPLNTTNITINTRDIHPLLFSLPVLIHLAIEGGGPSKRVYPAASDIKE